MSTATPAVDPARLSLDEWLPRAPALVDALKRLGLERVADLWLHFPLRYEDRTRITRIRDLRPGDKALVEGRATEVQQRFRGRPMLLVALEDDGHATLVLRFFHFNKSQAAQFEGGGTFRVFGEAREGKQGMEFVHPKYQRVVEDAGLDDRLTPVYPTVEGLPQARLQKLVAKALTLLPADRPHEVMVPELLPAGLGLSLRDAMLTLHQPPAGADLVQLNDGRHPARLRVAFEELVAHNLGLTRARLRIRATPAPRYPQPGPRRKDLLSGLPFKLTGAQRRVLGEIDADLERGAPMLRLVQGDVGSGKTVVAALAALRAIDAGDQVAVLAPTEVLADQHARNFFHWLEPLGVRCVRLTGAVKGKARMKALADIAGAADLVVGTHALVQEGVEFRALALAVIDEQHRFGVHQRLALRDKGMRRGLTPHQLVMTATPIPRTLAMTAYADLDCSVIDELPPGRTPVQTVLLADSRRDALIERIRVACREGRQAYWVCTLIDPSDELEAQAAEAAYTDLCAVLPEVKIGLVHGRLAQRDKQAAMAAFASNATQLLVATTVIEVGVDVPNASLMVIENAERLGLSQLHQLRGRVGRGAAASTCVLLYHGPLSETARARLELMRDSTDGFRIAEEDLRMRGPGELLGTRQTGEAGFRVASLERDAGMLPLVVRVAQRIAEEHPQRAEALVNRWLGRSSRYAQA